MSQHFIATTLSKATPMNYAEYLSRTAPRLKGDSKLEADIKLYGDSRLSEVENATEDGYLVRDSFGDETWLNVHVSEHRYQDVNVSMNLGDAIRLNDSGVIVTRKAYIENGVSLRNLGIIREDGTIRFYVQNNSDTIDEIELTDKDILANDYVVLPDQDLDTVTLMADATCEEDEGGPGVDKPKCT